MVEAQEIAEAVKELLWIRNQVVENAYENLFGSEVLHVRAQVLRIATMIDEFLCFFEGGFEIGGHEADFGAVKKLGKGSLTRLAQTNHQLRGRKIVRNPLAGEWRKEIIVADLTNDAMLFICSPEELCVPVPTVVIELIEKKQFLNIWQEYLPMLS